MRIEAYNQVQQVYNPAKVSPVQKQDKAVRTDNVQISSFGRDFQVAKQAIKNAPDVREELIAPLKDRVDSGTYEVKAEDFADKMIAYFD